MRLYCCYTPAHAVLFRDWFLPSVPTGFELVAEALEIEGAGDFLSPEFLRCIRLKLDRMVSSIEANAGRTIVWPTWTSGSSIWSRPRWRASSRGRTCCSNARRAGMRM